MDQKKVTYQFDHRSNMKYHLRVVSDLIDIAVNNAFVIFCKLAEKIQLILNMWIQKHLDESLVGN